jgi:nitrogen fixation/metabolism regulation signal transduction histidine kinase
VVLAAGVWALCLIAVLYLARRVSKPIEQLTAGLAELAKGNLDARLDPKGHDEISEAMQAFNRTAEQLHESREKLVHVTRLESWQTLARKMAHEVKNSLTPIRLTMEEIVARKNDRDDVFIEQAAQIVVDEVGTLQRRVRAFTEFASEPPVTTSIIDVNAIVEERITFLRSSHPEVTYTTALPESPLKSRVDHDLVKGVLTNLLENAAQAAGKGGRVLSRSFRMNGSVAVEIHDSGPGLSEQAMQSLFEPTISFKKTGMGLGLSIAKRSAMRVGGDIVLVKGELGGAAFRVLLPSADEDAVKASSGS